MSAHKIVTVFVMFSLLYSSSCCTIILGTHQEIAVSSQPASATIKVDGFEMATTPAVVRLQRKKSHTMELSKDGYESYSVAFARTVSPWIFGNILLGGVIGLVIDLIAGTIHEFNPESVHATLKSIETDS